VKIYDLLLRFDALLRTSVEQTVKCLLIHPNPESALDEEAGKQLLEDYEGYAKVSFGINTHTQPVERERPALKPDCLCGGILRTSRWRG
jgi:hypothetical protein